MHSHGPQEGSLGLPPTVSQVCHYWRQLAFGTPELWTTIVFRIDGSQPEAAERAAELELWLRRSRGCPISVTLCPTRFGRGTSSQGVHPAQLAIAEALVPHFHRIKTFFCDNNTGEVITLLAAWEASDHPIAFSALTAFVIRSAWVIALLDPSEEDAKAAKLILDNAPQLEEFSFPAACLPRDVTIPWDTLKTFCGRLTPRSIAELFRSSSAIELLGLDLVPNQCWPTAPRTPFPPLLHLTSLCLSWDALPSRPESLPLLPALRYLILRDHDRFIPDHSNSSQELLALLAIWGPQLYYLALPSRPTTSLVSSFLDLCTNLEGLRITSLKCIELLQCGYTGGDRLKDICHLELDINDEHSDISMTAQVNYVTTSILELMSDNLQTLAFMFDPKRMEEGDRMQLYDAKELARSHGVEVYIEECMANDHASVFYTPYFREDGTDS